MKFVLVKGESNIILPVFICDASSVVGAGLGGLDQTSGIVGGYVKRGGTGVALAVDENVTTEGTYEAPSSAAQVRIGTPANVVTGSYELHFDDALFTTADWVTISLTGADNMIPLMIEVQLTTFNLNDSAPQVDAVEVNSSAVAASNLAKQFDTTGITGDTFPSTQAQLGNIVLTGAAVSTPVIDAPNGWAPTWGIEVGDEDNTHAVDGVYHQITAEDDGGTFKIEGYYEFDIGSEGVPTSGSWTGYFSKGTGASKNITVQAWDWVASWDDVGVINSGIANTNEIFTLFTNHVGTGANLGKVRLQLITGSVPLANNTVLYTDQVFLSFAIVARSVGYADGAIWVKTVGGTAGTSPFINGVADKPVLTWADALTLSTSLGIIRFHIINGSTITLSGNSDGYTLIGQAWTLDLNSKSISAAYFQGAAVGGVGTGAISPEFENCHMEGVTLPPSHMSRCGTAGTFTVGSAGDFYFDNCHSMVAGTSSPILDFGNGVGATNVNFRDYSGGIEVRYMGDGAVADTMSLEGNGQLIIASTCTSSATIAIRGNFVITDNASGVVTLSDDARFDKDQVTAACGVSLVSIKLDHLVAVADSDDPVDNSIIAKLAATGADWSTFSSATDSLQSIRDRGDAAWITATSVTVSDKTGFSLAPDQSAVTIGTVNTTSTVTDGAKSTTALTNATWTDAKAGYIDVAISSRNAATPLTASGIRSAVGLASANLDTQLGDIPNNSEFIARTIVSADYFLVSDYTVPDAAGTGAALDAAIDGYITAAHVATDADIAALNDFDPANDDVAVVTLVNTCTANSDMVGTNNAALAATALSTAVWTGTKAGYIDVAISSRNSTTPLNAAQTQSECEDAINSLFSFSSGGDVIATLDGEPIDTDVDAIIVGLKASIGWTAGGTSTYAEVFKVMAAWAAGNWIEEGTDKTYLVKDMDDGVTTIFIVLGGEDSPYKTVTIV